MRTFLPARALLCAWIAAFALGLGLAPQMGAQTQGQGFGTPVILPGPQPYQLVTGDIQGLGRADLVAVVSPFANAQSGTIYLNQGTRVFGSGDFMSNYFAVGETIGDSYEQLVLGDFNHDGILDAAWTVNPTVDVAASIEVNYGVGKGAFANLTQFTSFETISLGGSGRQGSAPEANLAYLATIEFRNGGLPQLLTEDAANNILYVVGNQGDSPAPPYLSINGWSLVAQYPIAAADGAGPITVMDLNGDGIPDFVINGQTGYSATVYLGNGDGTFQPPVRSTFDSGVYSLLLHDMDGDGLPDMIVEGKGGRIEIFHGNGDGTFGTTSIGGTTSGDSSAGNGGHLVWVGDLNGDNVPDLLTATPLGLSVLLGMPSKNFLLQGPYATGSGHTAFAVADFNGDGLPDVAIDDPQGTAISYATPAADGGTVVASPEPSAFEGGYTLTATITQGYGEPAPAGTVTFTVDGTSVGTTPVTTSMQSGSTTYTATLALAADPETIAAVVPYELPGTHTLGAALTPAGGTASTLSGTHSVSLAATTVTLTPAPPSTTLGPTYYYGQGVNGYVHFNVLDSAYPPTGTWTQLSNGVAVPGCVDLSVTAAGGSECPYGYPQLLDSGSYVFTEAYNGGPANGDPINASSVSAPYGFSVMPDITTASALTSSMNPAQVGTAVTFTVTLTGNAAVPTGTVQFLDGTGVIGTGTLNASGQATFTTTSLAVGTHPITAVYAATLDFNGITSAVLNQVITPPPVVPLVSSVTLTSSLNPSVVGQAVTFTATASVPGPFPFLIQAGTMTFLDGANVIGTATIDQFGRAAFTTSTLALGSHPITASYPGGMDAGGQTIAASVSPVLTQVVGMGIRSVPPGFTLTVTPNPVVLKPGSTGVELVTVAAVSGFSQAVTLGCTGTNSSNELGCDFIEGTLPAGGGATTLDLTTTAPYACGGSPTKPYLKHEAAAVSVPACGVPAEGARMNGWRAAALGLPMVAGLVWIWPRRRRRWARLVALAVMAGAVGLSGCGNCSNLGTKPGNYTVTVTGTAGSVTQSVVVKIEVLDP